MVSGKGNISRGKGSNTSLKTTKIKRERISENEGSDDETTLPNIRNLESMKALPRFMSGKISSYLIKHVINSIVSNSRKSDR